MSENLFFTHIHTHTHTYIYIGGATLYQPRHFTWRHFISDFGYGKMSPNFLGKVSLPGIFEFRHMVKCRFSELIKCLQLVKCRISEKYKTGKVSSSKTNKVSTLRYGKMF